MSQGGGSPSALAYLGALVFLAFLAWRHRRLRREWQNLPPEDRPWDYRFGTDVRRAVLVFAAVFVISVVIALRDGASGRALVFTVVVLAVTVFLGVVFSIGMMAVLRILAHRR